MGGQPGLFDIDERLKELSAKGVDLERLNAIVDFELFRPDLEHAVPRSDRIAGGREAGCRLGVKASLRLQCGPRAARRKECVPRS
jgi:hypothetical protein